MRTPFLPLSCRPATVSLPQPAAAKAKAQNRAGKLRIRSSWRGRNRKLRAARDVAKRRASAAPLTSTKLQLAADPHASVAVAGQARDVDHVAQAQRAWGKRVRVSTSSTAC
jgi:hypothetical protein